MPSLPPSERPSEAPPAEAAGVRAIVAYKTIKAGIALSLGALLGLLLALGQGPALHASATSLRDHVTAGWSVKLADTLLAGSSDHGLKVTCLALLLGGTFASVQAWALRGGHWWGPWLVVAGICCLLPIEAHEIAKKPTIIRTLLFTVSLGVVVYLTIHARREHVRRKEQRRRLTGA